MFLLFSTAIRLDDITVICTVILNPMGTFCIILAIMLVAKIHSYLWKLTMVSYTKYLIHTQFIILFLQRLVFFIVHNMKQFVHTTYEPLKSSYKWLAFHNKWAQQAVY